MNAGGNCSDRARDQNCGSWKGEERKTAQDWRWSIQAARSGERKRIPAATERNAHPKPKGLAKQSECAGARKSTIEKRKGRGNQQLERAGLKLCWGCCACYWVNGCLKSFPFFHSNEWPLTTKDHSSPSLSTYTHTHTGKRSHGLHRRPKGDIPRRELLRRHQARKGNVHLRASRKVVIQRQKSEAMTSWACSAWLVATVSQVFIQVLL